MNILCITGDFLPQIGGMQLSTHQTLLALHEQGVSVTLIASPCQGFSEFDKHVPYKIFRRGGQGYIKALQQMLFSRSMYKKNHYDYVMLMGHFPEIAYALIAGWLPFLPIVLAGGTRLHYPNAKIKTWIRNRLLCRTYKRAQKIIAISEATKRVILSYCKTNKDILCIPRPIDECLWKKKPSPNDTFTIMTISRLTDTKNIEDIFFLLKELNELGINKWVFWLFGDGELKTRLKQLAMDLGITQQVVFWGELMPEALVDKAKFAHVNILLSKSESFGRVYIEAAALGIPSIGYETDGTLETIKDGYSGYLVKQGDRKKALQLLCSLYHDENLRKKLSKNALSFYRLHYSKAKIGQKLVDCIWESKKAFIL